MGRINKLNAYKGSATPGIFLRAKVVAVVGGFDEHLGGRSGSPWQGAEDTDYILRCVEQGFQIVFHPELIVFHPYKGETEPVRAFNYGLLIGKVWRKHRFPTWYVYYYLARSFGGMILASLGMDQLKREYYYQSLRGRWHGWQSKGS